MKQKSNTNQKVRICKLGGKSPLTKKGFYQVSMNANKTLTKQNVQHLKTYLTECVNDLKGLRHVRSVDDLHYFANSVTNNNIQLTKQLLNTASQTRQTYRHWFEHEMKRQFDAYPKL